MTETNKGNALDRYQVAAARTANTDHAVIMKRLTANPELMELINYSMGAAGEAGEIVDLIKKVAFHGHELDPGTIEKILFEVGDVMFYMANISRVLKTKLSATAGMNINKLKARYPDGFDEQKSINRDPNQA